MARTALRWLVAVVVVLHGLIHLLGAAKGLGWADVSVLPTPIGPAMGAAWLVTAVVVVAAGVMLARTAHWWWVAAAVAAAMSQAVIFTSWGDAKGGTIANVLLLRAAGYGYAAHGARSYRGEYRRRVGVALGQPDLSAGTSNVTEADLASLQDAVAAYVRQSGAVGRPHVVQFRARFHGRIRFSASKPWMSFVGEQLNTYGSSSSRLFFMDATMFGLPVDVLHVFVGRSATMRAKLCSLVPVVDAAGPEMDRGETVTLFNDLCILAPAALVDAPIAWRTLDQHRVRGRFTNGVQSVSADLVFNDDSELVDFVSDDRLRASSDGKSFTPQRWSTPVARYVSNNGNRVATAGEARWHSPAPEGEFTYLEYNLDQITYNSGSDRTGIVAAEANAGHAVTTPIAKNVTIE